MSTWAPKCGKINPGANWGGSIHNHFTDLAGTKVKLETKAKTPNQLTLTGGFVLPLFDAILELSAETEAMMQKLDVIDEN